MRKRAKSVACAWLFTLLCAIGAHAQAAIEVAQNLAADAQIATQQSKPLLLFFTQPGCPYCERARREYLQHLAVDPAYTLRVLFREVSIDSQVTGFDGKRSSGLVLARALGIKLYPTILIVDGAGKPLATPLRGFTVPDFYAAAIDSRIDEARKAMRERQ
jgi:thioredoxin-related protein